MLYKFYKKIIKTFDEKLTDIYEYRKKFNLMGHLLFSFLFTIFVIKLSGEIILIYLRFYILLINHL